MSEAIADKAHAKRSPSSTKRRQLCPASVVLEAGAGRKASRYAAEGTVAHQVLEWCIAENQDAEAYVGRALEADGYRFEVGMDMADAINECIAFIGLYIDPSMGELLMPETAVPVGHISGETGAEGTSDIIGVSDNGTRLVVLDLKYGKGVTVYARDEHGDLNLQLSYYALGAYELMKDLFPNIDTITMGIMQPRTNNFDTVTVSLDELLSVADQLRHIEAECDAAELIATPVGLIDSGLFNPSFDACMFCGAKATCPARNGDYSSAPSAEAADDDFEDLSV